MDFNMLAHHFTFKELLSAGHCARQDRHIIRFTEDTVTVKLPQQQLQSDPIFKL